MFSNCSQDRKCHILIFTVQKSEMKFVYFKASYSGIKTNNRAEGSSARNIETKSQGNYPYITITIPHFGSLMEKKIAFHDG